MSQATEAVQPESKQRQREVLRHSGWGVPFRIFQPRNLCFWVLLLGYAGGVTVALQGHPADGPGLLDGAWLRRGRVRDLCRCRGGCT